MNDDRVLAYLRQRSQVAPPPDLLDSVVGALAAAPQQRRLAFTSLVPAIAAMTAAGLVLAAVLFAMNNSAVGPGPMPSDGATPPPERADLNLLEEGATMTMDAVDPTGVWGTITLTRGPDGGGAIEDVPESEGFLLQVGVEYHPERMPDPPSFGADDWRLVRVGGGPPVADAIDLVPADPDPLAQTLGAFPGAVDIFTTPTLGALYWLVPRAAADDELELQYWPPGFDEPLTGISVRLPNDGSALPPDELEPSPEPIYVERGELPFSVIESSDADELFASVETCTNADAGYTVRYPSTWHTNPRVGDFPECSWFTPNFFDMTRHRADGTLEVPPEIVIILNGFEGAFGQIPEWPRVYSEEVTTVQGFGGIRAEDEIDEPADYVYHYDITLDNEPDGRKVSGGTYSIGQPDYLLHRAVLDRIMGSMVFDE